MSWLKRLYYHYRRPASFPCQAKRSSEHYAIAFVHIGDSLPPYLPVAVKQAQLFNPTTPIYVAASESALKAGSSLFRGTIHGISLKSLNKSDKHIRFLKTSSLDSGFREGFWTSTTERFFYYEALMQSYDLNNVFYLESDTLLYVNLQQLLPQFVHSYQGLAGPFDNKKRCIPCFIYAPHTSAIGLLTKFLAKHASQGDNDMRALARFREQYSYHCLANRPVIDPYYTSVYGLRRLDGRKEFRKKNYCGLAARFDSLFDAAALGQFLDGIDPRNGENGPGYINPSAVFTASKLSFSWERDSENRWVPYASSGKRAYRINNLHIHSKRLAAFVSTLKEKPYAP